MNLLDEIGWHMAEAETGGRGYALTGDERFLNPSIGSVEFVRLRLAELSRMLEADPNYRGRLERLDRLVEAKAAAVARLVDARRRAGLEAALEVVRGGEGRRAMDRLRAAIEEMRAA